jgi:hypothetical protein
MQQEETLHEIADNSVVVASLRVEITEAIDLVSSKKKKPEETGIGLKLNKLKALDLNAYAEMLEAWKPVSSAHFGELRKSDKRIIDERRKAEYQIMTMSTRGMSGDTGGYDTMQMPFKERARASAARDKKPLPEKAKKAKSPKFAPVDQSAFEFNGESYGKGPLVLAVVRFHAEKNKGITHEQMKAAFPDTLLRGYGIFTTRAKADELCKTRKRYFVKEDQLVKLSDETIAVCNQFTGDNIGAFLNQAKLLGYTIK